MNTANNSAPDVTQESPDVADIRQKARDLVAQVKIAKDDSSKKRAATTLMIALDTILTSPNRTGALLINFTKTLIAHKINHRDLIGLVSSQKIDSKQRHYVKTMAIVMFGSYTSAGREQIRKNGINYQEIEQVVGSDRFGALKAFLSGE